MLGAILILWCAFSNPVLRLPGQWERPLGPVSGCLTGIVNGVTGSQVMPAVPFLMSLHLDRNLFVQAANCSFTKSSVVMAIGISRIGLFDLNDVLISILGACFSVCGSGRG